MRLDRVHDSRCKGFTLIELLTVVLLISVIITFASLSVGQHSDKTIEEEAKRLHYLLTLAGEEAIVQSRSMALVFYKDGYEFAYIADDKLVPLEGDTIFRKRQLPDEVELELEYRGEPASFEDKDNPPRVYIFSSGEMTEFTLRLKFFDSKPYVVRANFLGQVVLLPPGSDEDAFRG